MFARSCPTNRRGAADGGGVGPKRAAAPSRRFPGYLRERLCELTLSPAVKPKRSSALRAQSGRATAEEGGC